MKILLTNDDGIHAKGLEVLYHALADLGDIVIVAPENEMSASAHSITMTQPLRAKEIRRNGSFWGLAVNGTPADAAKLALTSLLKSKPDLVISGINQGVNSGLAAIYSGTVSAASEGCFVGVPSLAVSLADRHHDNFLPSARITRVLAERLLDHKSLLPRFSMLNVNIPPLPLAAIKGVRITRQGMGGFRDAYERREDPRGVVYYWLNGAGFNTENDQEADEFAVQEGYVTITPLRYDLTDFQLFDSISTLIQDLHPAKWQ
jgi:5'-nucleotidase